MLTYQPFTGAVLVQTAASLISQSPLRPSRAQLGVGWTDYFSALLARGCCNVMLARLRDREPSALRSRTGIRSALTGPLMCSANATNGAAHSESVPRVRRPYTALKVVLTSSMSPCQKSTRLPAQAAPATNGPVLTHSLPAALPPPLATSVPFS